MPALGLPDSKGWRAGKKREPARTYPLPGTTLRERWPWPEASKRQGSSAKSMPGALQLPIQRGLSHKHGAHTAREKLNELNDLPQP